MSIKLMSVVWTLGLRHDEQSILLALADHAHDDGTDARPSLGYLAWKTGYSLRSVKRIVARLRSTGVIQVEEEGGGRVSTVYRLYLDRGKTKPPYQRLRPRIDRGHFDTGDTRGLAAVSPMSPQSLVEPSVKDSPLTGRHRPTQISKLVDRYRSLDGITPSPKDGGVIAGLVGRLGEAKVAAALDEAAEAIIAADNPLLFLIAVAEGRGRRDDQSLEDRAKELARR